MCIDSVTLCYQTVHTIPPCEKFAFYHCTRHPFETKLVGFFFHFVRMTVYPFTETGDRSLLLCKKNVFGGKKNFLREIFGLREKNFIGHLLSEGFLF